MIALLTALAPFITALGLKLIDLFVKNAADNAKAKTDFLAAIQSHLNDAIKSVNESLNYQQQIQELSQQQKDTTKKT